jgi:hypothetical protein
MAIGYGALIAVSVLCLAVNRSMAQVAAESDETPSAAYSATPLGEAGVAMLPTIAALERSAEDITLDSVALVRDGARAATEDLLFAGFPDLLLAYSAHETDGLEALAGDAAEPDSTEGTSFLPRPIILAALGAGLIGLGVWVLRPGRSGRRLGFVVPHDRRRQRAKVADRHVDHVAVLKE